MLTARGGARRGVMTEKLKDSDIDQVIIDEYEIGETLGTGHFSKVKLGIDRKTGEKVAIKASFCPPPLPASTRCCCPHSTSHDDSPMPMHRNLRIAHSIERIDSSTVS